jgi:hypothetical protein
VAALVKIRTYRLVCGVPYDVGYDPQYIECCQRASELLVKVGSLTHHPTRPAGVDDDLFRLGAKGCGESNLSQGSGIPGSIDSYMDDSDPSNIDRVGHRRWVLNPGMRNTGIGGSGAFSALYAFDHGRTAVPDYDLVSYPARGYHPLDLFHAGHAWHVSFNPERYALVSDECRLAIYPLGPDLKRAGKPLELDYFHVDKAGFGVPGAIIARPKALVLKKGAAYEVEVTGLKPVGDHPPTLRYIVSFY